MNNFFLNEKMSAKLISAYKYGTKNNSSIETLIYAISHINISYLTIDDDCINSLKTENSSMIAVYYNVLSSFEHLNQKHIEKQKENIRRFRALKEKNGETLKYSVDSSYSRIKPLSSIKLSDVILEDIIKIIKRKGVGKSSICDLFLLFYNFQNNTNTVYEDDKVFDKIAYVFYLSMKQYLKTVVDNYVKTINKNAERKNKKEGV